MATFLIAVFGVLLFASQPTHQADAAAGTTGAISTKSSTVALNVAVAFEVTNLESSADYAIVIDSNTDEKFFNWTTGASEISRIILITFGSGDVSANLIVVSLTNADATDLDQISLTVTQITDIISTTFLIGLFGVLFVLGVLVIIMKSIRKG